MSMTTPRLLMLVACVLLQTLATYANAIPDPSDRETGPKIINGTQAEANATRHQVSVRRRRNDSYFFGTGHICGGSLITPSVVLSAAHCFVDYDSENGTFALAATFIVVMGNLDRFERNNNTLVYDITHILYRVEKFNLSSFEQDVALAFLAQDVPASHPTVRPIALHRAALVDDTMCQVTGWGNTEEGYLSDVLMTVDVPIITAGVCGQETDIPPSYLHEGMVCAGYSEGERDACGGDSGGPLVCGGLLAGIVSWGSGCAQPRLPGVYTDVSFHAPWIAARVEEAGGTLAGNGAAATAGSSPLLAVVAAGLLVLLTTLPRE